MPNIQELTEERLNQLDRLLLEWAVEEEDEETEGDYWEVSTLDGYFTALILGPRIAPSSEWLPPILNTLTFESAEEFDLMFGLLMSLHHYRALQWAENPEDFEPLGFVLESPDEEEPDQPSSPDEWCRGFMLGVALQHREWQPLYAKKEHAAWLFNIQALADPELRKHLQSDFRERWRELREQWIATVPVAVVQLYRFWRAREHKGEPTPSSSRLKVGRNDPCPCGSGQKFKKCCGNRPPVLH